MRYHNYRLKSKRIKQNIANYVMLFPAIAYILIFSFYPIFSGVIMSFNDVRITGASTFNGVANYEKVFADPAFWSALKNTFILHSGIVFTAYFCRWQWQFCSTKFAVQL